MSRSAPSIAVVVTVKNDPQGCADTLRSLLAQTLPPDEILLVDGGSSDETITVARRFAEVCAGLRIIEAPGANIARGRNIGTQAASATLIATTDCGCHAEPDWLRQLVQPLVDDFDVHVSRPPAPASGDPAPACRPLSMVAGFYEIASQTLFERVVGMCTMRGQLEPVDPARFNASGRSMAYTKEMWRRVGGWPEWIGYSEDTLFSQHLRDRGIRCIFAGNAVVHWRPRSSIAALARQFYNYGTGRGHTQIGAADFAYNLRNLGCMAGLCLACILSPWAIPMLCTAWAYFYVWTFHAKAARVAYRCGRFSAYPLAIFVMWVVLLANATGYVVGSLQRRQDRERFERRLHAYTALSA